MADKFHLAEHERHSALWRALMRRCEDRLTELRQSNDADRDPEATARIRGQIAEVKAFLALDKSESPTN